MIRKIFSNFIKIVLIISPIIVLYINFINTFWGSIYKLDVNTGNITVIQELLHKDNIKIELCGQGLCNYDSLDFYYSDGKIKSVKLYINKQHYYIYEYLYKNTFNYDDVFKFSIFISLLTIGVTIFVEIKKKKSVDNKNYNR
jgi:hypothetical protein